MVNLEKPLLMNGFTLSGNIAIIKRLDRFFFTDIYELSNGKFLYLFIKLQSGDIKNRKKTYEFIDIELNSETYTGVIDTEYSRKIVSKIFADLTTNKGFASVAGMKELKLMLTTDVINPLTSPERFKKFKVSIPNGILLYGPPGTGKTFIVRKLAEELDYKFFDVKHSDLATPFIHGAVGNIGEVFAKAEALAPAILFFDEISGLVPDRKNMTSSSSHKEEEVNEFLMQLHDAADKKILVVGATNYIDRIDPAVLRPGRFDKKIYVGLPDSEARKALFQIGLSTRPISGIDFNKLSEITEGLSAADIVEGIVENASRIAANLDLDAITQDILEKEITQITPTPKQESRVGFIDNSS